uniref:Putative helicase senataxin n=1 Tax=Magallana gigas TaxID=29159 RepID=K1RT27_MAGGI
MHVVQDKKEQRKAYEPPPVSPTVYPIPEKFNSYQDYVNIFIPHLLQEAWEQSYQSWSQLKTLNSYPQICAVYSGVERSSTTTSSQTFEKYTWYSITTKDTYEAMRKNDHLGEKFLVIIKDYGHYLKSKDREMDQKYYQPNNFDQIGYIEKIQLHSRPGSLEQTINTFKPVASLVTIVRQFQAVSFLPRSPVCKHILLPGRQDVFYEKVTISDSEKHSLKHYNESQQLAICTASQMILGNPQSPKIGLLQGPPGTGKSSTVVGIVEKVLQFLGSNVRICLCAPSNNAVDLLIKRLDDHRKKMVNTEFASALSIVRIGNAECVHRDVKKFRLSDIFQEECIKCKWPA